MLDLNIEKTMPLTSQEQYDIINAALDMANDNGFINQFVFEHALWCLTANTILDDIPEETSNIIQENPIQAWDTMLKEGTIEELFNNYNESLAYFAQAAAQYYADYKDYLLSIGGAFSQTDMLSTNNLDTFTKQLQDFMNNDNTLKTLNIADEWGMNNKTDKEEIQEKREKRKLQLVENLPEDSLFK